MTLRIFIAALFVLLLVAATAAQRLQPAVLALYLTSSLLAYAAYAIDKSAAIRRQRRTPESTLHLLALAGGWPGALVAQQQLRHKSKKTAFLAVFWATVTLNCGTLWWWLR